MILITSSSARLREVQQETHNAPTSTAAPVSIAALDLGDRGVVTQNQDKECCVPS